MSSKEKLVDRFKSQPRNFTFDEMVRLFKVLGFDIDNKGGTSGSRIEFINHNKMLSYNMHKPHPEKEIKSYVMKQVFEYFMSNGLIK